MTATTDVLRRTTPLFAAALLLCACSDGGMGSFDVGEAELADTVCAAGETVEGIDVSRWQEGIDWPAVAADGIHFAIARAAYGTDKDTWFDQNWPAMKQVGLVRGAYQWFLPQNDPIEQAQFLLDTIGPLGPNDLPPVADVEDDGGQSPSTIVSKLAQWVAHIESKTGRKPIIYSGKYFWQDYVQSADFTDLPYWVPNYSADCPNLPNGAWTDWQFFQYTSTGSVNGVVGNVDRNLFNGTLQDLKALAGGGYAAEFVSQSFPYAADGGVTIEAGEALEAYIELRNVGSKPWNESTRLATTEPRDRDSVFAGKEWPAKNRYAAVEGVVQPGETYKFTFTLHAPPETGTFTEFFGLVQDGEAWFSDPGHGGPPDTQLQGIFEVVPNPEGNSAGVGGSGAGGTGSGEGGTPWEPDGDAPLLADDGGCATGSAPARSSGAPGLALLLALALAARRRVSHPLA
jgi:lysozyme